LILGHRRQTIFNLVRENFLNLSIKVGKESARRKKQSRVVVVVHVVKKIALRNKRDEQKRNRTPFKNPSPIECEYRQTTDILGSSSKKKCSCWFSRNLFSLNNVLVILRKARHGSTGNADAMRLGTGSHQIKESQIFL
jgi:hypothetical protein